MRIPILALMPVLAAAPASAGLLGQEIDVTFTYEGPEIPLLLEPYRITDTVVVGLGAEISITRILCAFNLCEALLPLTTIDVDDTSITYAVDLKGQLYSSIHFIPTEDFLGFEFSKLNAGGNKLGPIVLTTNIRSLDMSRISSTDSMIRVNMESLTVADGSFFTLSFAPRVGEVPEPSTWGFLLTGLGAGWAARRARRRPTA